MNRLVLTNDASQFTGKLNKLIFIRSATFAEATEPIIKSTKVQSQFRTPFSMDQFCLVITNRLAREGIDLSACFIDSGNYASRETLRACMKNFGANGEAPKSLSKHLVSPDGPPFSIQFVDALNVEVCVHNEDTICIFVHEDDAPQRMMHGFDRAVGIKMWDAGHEVLTGSGDILVIDYSSGVPQFTEIPYKEKKKVI